MLRMRVLMSMPILVIVFVRVIMRVRVVMRVLVVTRVAVAVIVCMGMIVGGLVFAMVLNAMLVRMGMRSIAFSRDHIHLGPGNPTPHHLARLKTRAHIQPRRRLLQQFQRHTGIHHGAQKHVAANAGKTIQIGNPHRYECKRRALG